MVFVLGVDTPSNVSHRATSPFQRPPSQSRRGDGVHDYVAYFMLLLLGCCWLTCGACCIESCCCCGRSGNKLYSSLVIVFFRLLGEKVGVFCFFCLLGGGCE
ncbi:unnamed protein product [Ectocarpus sp. 12 AP-2014]